MKKFLLLLLVLVGIGGFARIQSMKASLASRYSIEDLRAIATEANKSLPTMVDQVTRLDSIVASELSLEKRFTLTNSKYSDIDRDELNKKLLSAVKSDSCQSKQSQILHQSGISEKYSYFDLDGKLLTTFTIGKASCA